MKTCSIEGCERPAKARGYCNLHYTRWHKHGDPEKKLPTGGWGWKHGRKAPYDGVICKVEGCDKQATAKGYCHKHYNNTLRIGKPVARSYHHHEICTVEGCSKPHQTMGYCTMHYGRVRQHGDPHYVNPHRHAEYINRNRAIFLMYDAGYTLQSIGDILGVPISRERVRQIVEHERKRAAIDTGAKR